MTSSFALRFQLHVATRALSCPVAGFMDRNVNKVSINREVCESLPPIRSLHSRSNPAPKALSLTMAKTDNQVFIVKARMKFAWLLHIRSL